jgi:hypothetical protein
MKFFNTVAFIAFIHVTCLGQKADQFIKEKEVTRILKTLSADEMMGRPASKPELIEKATSFIENEFKKIGLKPLKGLTSFRQEIQKDQISPLSVDVILDGEKIAADHLILASEKVEINIDKGLAIKSIDFDKAAANKDQYFFGKAFSLARDTSSAIILVAPEFQSSFKEFKGYFEKRFMNGGKSTKVFVLGKGSVSSYSIKAKQTVSTILMNNVVGVLEGKTKPDEIVVFSGHYDHLGNQQSKMNGDSIANGADDDASGTTAVIALARYFKKLKSNNRTLIFVALTAEEIGGFGSQYFSKQLDADKVVAMFNIEMIGKPSKWGKNHAFITGYERSDFGVILQKNLAGTSFEIHPDPYPEQNLFYRSDNATLARLGVPAHSISTDQIPSDKLYHSVDDEFESLDMDNLTRTIKAIALSSKSIVDGSDTPKRIDKTAVR